MSRTLAKGHIVLTTFPFADLTGQKLRPALVVSKPNNGEIILAFITSRLSAVNPEAELLLEPADPESLVSGLKWHHSYASTNSPLWIKRCYDDI